MHESVTRLIESGRAQEHDPPDVAAARQVLKTDEGITRARGVWGEWRLAEGDVSAPVMPTLHPAFLLRQPQAKREVWADLLDLAARFDAAR